MYDIGIDNGLNDMTGEAPVPPATSWVIPGVGSWGGSSGSSVVVDKASNIFTIVRITGSIGFGGKQHTGNLYRDAFVAQLNTAGTLTNAFFVNTNNVLSAALDKTGNIYVTGSYYETLKLGTFTHKCVGHSDIFVAKFTPQGKVLWAASAGGTGNWVDEAKGLAVDSSGNVYINGSFTDNARFGTTTLTGSPNNAFVAKLDNMGQYLWAIGLPDGAGGPVEDSIATDKNGNCYITGRIYKHATFGTTGLTHGLYVAKLNSIGKYVWAMSVDGISGKAIEVDDAGNSFVAGSATVSSCGQSQCTCLIKVNPNGKRLWTVTMGQGGLSIGSYAENLSIDKAGNSYIAGPFRGTVKFGSQSFSTSRVGVFVAKLDAKGKVLWAESASSSVHETYVNDLTLDTKGNTYVTGFFRGNVNFGTVTVNGGDGHAYVWKLASGVP